MDKKRFFVIDKYIHYFISPRNGFFVGLIFVSLGFKIGQYLESNRKIIIYLQN